MTRITRRSLISTLGLSAGASLMASHVFGADASTAGGKTWRYAQLDPAAVAEAAYCPSKDLGCMYGVFASLCDALGKAVGEPFTSFPCEMMGYGRSGAGGYGSLCGALNGAAAMIGLLVQEPKAREELITEVFAWYERTALPLFQPKSPVQSEDIPQTVARSVLCHISVGRWVNTSGCNIASVEREDRCKRLTASVAAKTVELLNAHFAGGCAAVGLTEPTKACIVCHGKGQLANAQGKMDCGTCHTFTLKKHP